MQDWGTRVNSGYFKFLQLKLRVVEMVPGRSCQRMSTCSLSARSGPIVHERIVAIVRCSPGSYDDNLHCPARTRCTNRTLQTGSAPASSICAAQRAASGS